jgi:diphthamide biosynthesis protein 2
MRQETLNVNRALMQRYYLVQKAKDCDVIGILVGTLAVGNIYTCSKNRLELTFSKLNIWML